MAEIEWKTSAQTADVNIGETVDKALEGRGSRGLSFVGEGFNRSKYGDDDIVGIDAKSIPSIKAALNRYITSIQGEIDKLNTQVNSRNGVIGNDINDAIKEYLVKVSDYLKDLMTYLKVFNDKLSAVEEAWNNYQKNVSGNIGSSTSGIKTTAYTETRNGQ